MKKIINFILCSLFYFFPINKNKIVLCNFVGKGYGGNPKYIAEYMEQNYKTFKMYWLSRNLRDKFPQYVKPVRIYRFWHYYHLMTAKVIINNTRCSMRVPKKNGQIYLQTWHASFGGKKIEKDAEEKLTKEYLKEAKEDGKKCDAILSSCLQMTNQIKRAFWLNDKAEILEYGIPRNDFLIRNKDNREKIEQIKKSIGIQSDFYIVLYAPTFRDTNDFKGYQLDFDGIHNAFEKRFNKKVIILMRKHPNISNVSNIFPNKEYMIDVTNYPDMQELIIACDFILTDYSSVDFDGMIIQKPVFEITLDLKEYNETRGLIDEYYLFPFLRAKTNKELVELIENFDEKCYFKKIEEYQRLYPIFDSGEATKKCCEWIVKHVEIRRN